MSYNAKIHLRVKLKNSFVHLKNGYDKPCFNIYIKLIEKDKRFSANYDNGGIIVHVYQKEKFRISSFMNDSIGSLSENSISLPSLTNFNSNYEMKLSFNSESDRYKYLKRLYKSIIDWCDNFYEFTNDGKTTTILIEDYWLFYNL